MTENNRDFSKLEIKKQGYYMPNDKGGMDFKETKPTTQSADEVELDKLAEKFAEDRWGNNEYACYIETYKDFKSGYKAALQDKVNVYDLADMLDAWDAMSKYDTFDKFIADKNKHK